MGHRWPHVWAGQILLGWWSIWRWFRKLQGFRMVNCTPVIQYRARQGMAVWVKMKSGMPWNKYYKKQGASYRDEVRDRTCSNPEMWHLQFSLSKFFDAADCEVTEGGATFDFVTGLSTPRGLCWDGDQTIYVADEAGCAFSDEALVGKLHMKTCRISKLETRWFKSTDFRSISMLISIFSWLLAKVWRFSSCSLWLIAVSMHPARHRETSRTSLLESQCEVCVSVMLQSLWRTKIWNLYILSFWNTYIYIYTVYDVSKIYGHVMLCHNFGDLPMPKVLLPGCWRSWALNGGGRHGGEIRIFMKRGNTHTDTYSFL